MEEITQKAAELALDDRDDPYCLLQNWETEVRKNGVFQRTDEWARERQYTTGGSSLAILQGNYPYSTVNDLVHERAGLAARKMGIAPSWGTLFEHVIARYIERARDCKVKCEDAFVMHNEDISYSPDGLAVMEVPCDVLAAPGEAFVPAKKATGQPKKAIVLLEFKCPYSRLPKDAMPNYYIPQVKMGLDVIKISQVGLFVEAVFRRCSLPQLGLEPGAIPHAKQPMCGGNALATGIIGFYAESMDVLPDDARKLHKMTYSAACADLGIAPNDLITAILSAFDKGTVKAWYGDVRTTAEAAKEDVLSYAAICNKVCNIGVLPWKLFRCEQHFIPKTPNYLEPWNEDIRDINRVARMCADPANSTHKKKICQEYIDKRALGAFDDL